MLVSVDFKSFFFYFYLVAKAGVVSNHNSSQGLLLFHLHQLSSNQVIMVSFAHL